MQPPDGEVFAQSPELWAAVRRYTAPAARVANNPLFLQDLTPWPVNISWALLADRTSALPVANWHSRLRRCRRTPRSDQRAIHSCLRWEGTADDVHDMATKYRCDVVVIVPQDKAWDDDPFTASPDYHLAETRDGRWRIYVRG